MIPSDAGVWKMDSNRNFALSIQINILWFQRIAIALNRTVARSVANDIDALSGCADRGKFCRHLFSCGFSFLSSCCYAAQHTANNKSHTCSPRANSASVLVPGT